MLNSLHLPGRPADTRVVVAMSGGVDSSVVAGLLKAEGYDVVGITLQLYDHGQAIARKGACCAGQDIQDARRVAETLQIPHYVLDYEARFKQAVMGEFADSYVNGETPVPCVACNQKIKFRDLLETAAGLGAQALATGHYVKSMPGETGFELHRAEDKERDQSYFLFATTKKQLEFLRFPLGDRPKEETRALAREFGLAVAEKSDSQDICFVPTGRYTQVIERLRPGAAEPGNIVHVDGRVLGRHGGIINYTIGQRKGIGVAAPEPLYVVKLDAARREVVVGPREALRARTLDFARRELARRRAVRGRGRKWRRGAGADPVDRAVAAGDREPRQRRRDRRPCRWRGGRVPGTGLRILCRDRRRGAASRRRMDQVRRRRSLVGQKRFCGACIARARGSVRGRVALGPQAEQAVCKSRGGSVAFKSTRDGHGISAPCVSPLGASL